MFKIAKIDYDKLVPIRSFGEAAGQQVNWLGGDVGKRTLDMGGTTYREDTGDFSINPANNRAYVNPSKATMLNQAKAYGSLNADTLNQYRPLVSSMVGQTYKPKFAALERQYNNRETSANQRQRAIENDFNWNKTKTGINQRNDREKQAYSLAKYGGSDYMSRKLEESYQPIYAEMEMQKNNALLNLSENYNMGMSELDGQYGDLLDSQTAAENKMLMDIYDREQKNALGLADATSNYGKDIAEADKAEFDRDIDYATTFKKDRNTGEYTLGGRGDIIDMTGIDPETGQPSYSAMKDERQFALDKATKEAQINKYNLDASGRDTVSERQNAATADLLNKAVGRYNENMQNGLKYPGYYTVSSLLSDPEWMIEAKKSGASSKDAIDMLLTSIGTTPAEFFTGETAKLLPLYNQLGGGDSALMSKALSAAQKDPNFGIDPETDRELINYYKGILSGGSGAMGTTGTPTTGATDEEIQQYLK